MSIVKKVMNTRKFFLLITLALLFIPLHAQWFIGGKLGLNASTMNLPGEGKNPSYNNIGINGGLASEYQFNQYFSLLSELLYMKQGFSDKIIEYETPSDSKSLKFNMYFHCLEIPILVKFKHKTGLNLQVGPQIGLLLKQNIELEEETQSQSREKRPVNLSMVVGIGYDTVYNLSFDLRYQLGLTSIYKENNGFQCRSFYFGVGYKFKL